MARQNITTTHPLTWEKIQNEFNKVNANFLEIYAATGADFTAINSSIIPSTDNTSDLGENLKRWKDLYLSGVEFQNPQDITDLDTGPSGAIDFTTLGVSSITSNVLIINPTLETTITLPNANDTGMAGIKLVIKNYSSAANINVVDPSGPTTLSSLTPGTAILLISDGYSWTKISDSSSTVEGDITVDSIQLETGNRIGEFSNDSSMLDNATDKVPTQFAVKSYVDSSISGISIPSDISQLTDSTSLLTSNEDIDDRVAALISAGNNMSVSYSDIANLLTIGTKNSLNFGTLYDTLSSNLTLSSDPEYQRFILTASTAGLHVQLPDETESNYGILYIFTNNNSGVSYTVRGVVATFVIPDNVTKIIAFNGVDYGVIYSSDAGTLSSFSTISVAGQSNLEANSSTDTLTLVAGDNITLTTDSLTDSITISAATPPPGSDIGDLTIVGNTIDSDDSSAIIFTPAVMFDSDVTVGNTLTVKDIEVTGDIITSGSGTPELVSINDILLTAGTRVELTSSPLKLASYTSTDRDNIIAENGDMIYNTTTNKFQGYQNGSWINLDGTV